MRRNAPVPPDAGPAGRDPGGPRRPVPAEPGRRRFLSLGWLLVGGALAAEIAWVVAGSRRRDRGAPAAGSPVVTAGPVERFARGSVTAFPAGGFHLVRLPDGGFLALAVECTHLGCPVAWSTAKGRFVCPCHRSVFDLRGEPLLPPADRPLDLYGVRIHEGVVTVDTSVRTRRDAFDPHQAIRA